MRRRGCYVCVIHFLCPLTLSITRFALLKDNKVQFAKSASTLICKISPVATDSQSESLRSLGFSAKDGRCKNATEAYGLNLNLLFLLFSMRDLSYIMY